MSGLFRWSMRHGAKILFAVAVIQLVAALLLPLDAMLGETIHMASDHNYRGSLDPQLLLQLSQLLYGVANAAFLLAAALIVDRADRWLAVRAGGEAAQ